MKSKYLIRKEELNAKHKELFMDCQATSTRELAKVIGVELEDDKPVSLESIIGNVPPTLSKVVLASMELYERLNRYPTSVIVSGFNDVVSIARSLFSDDQDYRSVWLISLNQYNVVVGVDEIVFGKQLDSKSINLGCCRTAVKNLAQNVIAVYNSLDCNSLPNGNDIELVKGLKNALGSVGVGLVDNVIVAKGGECYSFAEECITR